MLANPTHERLLALGLTGMAKAFDDQRRQPDIDALCLRGAARPAARPRGHRAREQTTGHPPEVRLPCGRPPSSRTSICAAPRGLDRAFFAKLAAGDWIEPQTEPAGHRPDRGRQELDRLRPRPQGLPRQSLGPLPSRCRGCSRRSRSPAATAAMPGCSRRSRGSSC